MTPWLAELDDDQRRAVLAPLGPVAVIAGPGAGKTRTVVARISQIGVTDVAPDRILALTHTTKAAGELRDRVGMAGVEGVWSATIHSAALRQVRQFWKELDLKAEPQLVPSTYVMVRRAAESVWGRNTDQGRIIDTLSEIDWAGAQLLTPETYAKAAKEQGRTFATPFEEVSKVWAKFVEAKRRDNVVDFADILALATKLMDVEEVCTRVRNKFGAVFVDEYQDVDPAQHRLITAWLGDNPALTVVGDAEQSVFSFKGADPSYLTDFAATHPDAVVVHLVKDYRSSPEVVSWVNKLTLAKRPALTGMKPAGPQPAILRPATEGDEERALVEAIRGWRKDGIAYEEMAILYRFNAASARVEAALSAASIPYHVAGSSKFFERPEIKAILIPFGAMARANPDTDGVLLLTDAAKQTGWTPDNPPEGMGAARQRWEAVAALLDTCNERYPDWEAAQLLSALQQRAREAHDMTPGGVSVTTIHGAKGLEWECVWILGAVEGQMPSVYATTDAQLDEEQHLMYVAVSRAKTHLVVSAADKRHNSWSNKPSRYLNLLAPRQAPTSSRAGTGTGSRHGSSTAAARAGSDRDRGAAAPAMATASVSNASCASCGNKLIGAAARISRRCSGGCLDGVEAAQYRKLFAWRAERAAETGELADKVATDKALFSIAVRNTTDSVPGLSAAHAKSVPLH